MWGMICSDSSGMFQIGGNLVQRSFAIRGRTGSVRTTPRPEHCMRMIYDHCSPLSNTGTWIRIVASPRIDNMLARWRHRNAFALVRIPNPTRYALFHCRMEFAAILVRCDVRQEPPAFRILHSRSEAICCATRQTSYEAVVCHVRSPRSNYADTSNVTVHYQQLFTP